MDKQPTTKYTHKTKDRVSRTLLKTGGELMLPILTILTTYKGKVKTHNYINRQNQSTTGKL
jgi:hypothetical protein